MLVVGEQVGHGGFVSHCVGVPPFIPNEALEQELMCFRKFVSGFRVVNLGCKDAKL